MHMCELPYRKTQMARGMTIHREALLMQVSTVASCLYPLRISEPIMLSARFRPLYIFVVSAMSLMPAILNSSHDSHDLGSQDDDVRCSPQCSHHERNETTGRTMSTDFDHPEPRQPYGTLHTAEDVKAILVARQINWPMRNITFYDQVCTARPRTCPAYCACSCHVRDGST
ncbi:hypothetical protein PENSPDRAFT_186651 [Peniophora sp. CONT]|nr:hypothetical protein PENSPDRAFT_186651 [Peniophora sp. CONT]